MYTGSSYAKLLRNNDDISCVRKFSLALLSKGRHALLLVVLRLYGQVFRHVVRDSVVAPATYSSEKHMEKTPFECQAFGEWQLIG